MCLCFDIFSCDGAPFDDVICCLISRFPDAQRRPELHRIWLENVNKHAPVKFVPTKSSCLCSEHFTADMFYKKGNHGSRAVLKPSAVPTIFNQWLSQVSLSAIKPYCFVIHTYLPVFIVYICK